MELWGHQKIAIDRAKPADGFGLFFEPGTGKTRTVIEILKYKFRRQARMLRTLVFCPPIVVENWWAEWHKFAGFSSMKTLIGSGQKRVQDFTSWSAQGGIFITNYESLLMKPLFQAFLMWSPEAIVFDESHRLKNPSAKTARQANLLANPPMHPPYKYLLSGSPVLNSPLDLFQQFKILDGGETFGTNFFVFRNKYFEDKNAAWRNSHSRKYFPNWQPRLNTCEEINHAISGKSMVVKKSECLDLPPIMRIPIKVEMSPEQKRIYNEMAKDYIAFVGDQVSSATLAITKALRLMQITSGFVAIEGHVGEQDGFMKALDETPKLSALKELLQELTPHSKVIVWATWKANYEVIGKLCDELGLETVFVHGGISQKQKDANVKRFNEDEKCRVLCGHPGSGGIGINLVVAPYSIFYSRTFSLEHSLQAEARNYRGGSEIHEKITRYDLICSGTIDEEVVGALYRKEEIGAKILHSLVKEV